MSSTAKNIHPIFDQALKREDKEKLLGQRGAAVWFTGLSGSGKSTIAKETEKRLNEDKYLVKLLDGDNVRHGINKNLGFSEEDRIENIRRVAEITKLFVETGIITINSFISPTRDIRSLARSIIGEKDFYEIYIECPLEVCEQRDVKGLYKKARAGEIPDFTGIHSPFEAPESPALILNTEKTSLEDSVTALFDFIINKIQEA